MTKVKRLFFKLIKKSPASMEMISYWRTKESVAAKITKAKDGSQIMIMEGEKYPLTTYPRGYLLYGKMSKLKHEIKNQVFNESWRKLEEGMSDEEVIADIKETLHGSITELADTMKYDMLPPETMCPSVREIYRAWTKVGGSKDIRNYLCFILQEDDSYRYRVQWLATWFGWFMKLNPLKSFEYALTMLEHGEVISDMKERQRLLKRILMLVLKDKNMKEKFIALFREINWKKVKLARGDKFHFRGKHFKADLDLFDY